MTEAAMKNPEQTTMHGAVRDGIARSLAVIGLAGMALIHLLDLPGQLIETPYIFVLYLALMIASVALAGVLIGTTDALAWAAATALSALVVVAYVLSPTSGLASSTHDIGHLIDPLGTA